MATVIAKIGTSSLTDESGMISRIAIARTVGQIATLRIAGHRVVLVTSAAVAAGVQALGLGHRRPTDVLTLQALSAVGQSRLMREWDDAFGAHSLVSGQVLLTPTDFFDRRQYLHARATIGRLLDLGVVPVINENDTIASDEIRFGDNDRIAALVAHLVGADLLVLLTDTSGLFTANPTTDPEATLIEHIDEVTPELESMAGSAGSVRGSGGMRSKLRAAKIASWSGVRAVIAGASRDDVLMGAVEGRPGIGTVVAPHDRRLSARKLWIAFAGDTDGSVTVDAGALRALQERSVSLLAAGATAVNGTFDEGSLIELWGPDQKPFARGVTRCDSQTMESVLGKSSAQHGRRTILVHRDDLVILP